MKKGYKGLDTWVEMGEIQKLCLSQIESKYYFSKQNLNSFHLTINFALTFLYLNKVK